MYRVGPVVDLSDLMLESVMLRRQIRRHNAPLGYMARRGTYLPPLFLSGVRGQPGFLPTPAICALSNNHRTLKKKKVISRSFGDENVTSAAELLVTCATVVREC